MFSIRKLPVFLALVLFVACFTGISLHDPNLVQAAAKPTVEYTAYSVYVKGVKVKFSGTAKLNVSKGAPVVPFAPYLKALGAPATYDSKSKAVSAKNARHNLKLKAGSRSVTHNGKAKTIAVAPVTVSGTVMVPVKDVAQLLGYQVVSRKQVWLSKLNAIEKGMSDLKYLEDGSTADMIEAGNISLQRWDKALNQIWALLKKDMPKSAYNTLLNNQRQWLKTRDRNAENARDEWEGGTFGNVVYVGVLSGQTRDRNYFLVRNYM